MRLSIDISSYYYINAPGAEVVIGLFDGAETCQAIEYITADGKYMTGWNLKDSHQIEGVQFDENCLQERYTCSERELAMEEK